MEHNKKSCEKFPCAYYPEDFKDDKGEIFDKLIAALKTGKLAIVWVLHGWDVEEKSYFVSPKAKGNKKLFYKIKSRKKGECIFSSKSGCELELENRPYTCKNSCVSYVDSIQQAINLWSRYNNLLGMIEIFLKK